ncbi:alpha/beta hydrolase [Kitasatospora sp. NPDC088391]|uniref:alpha/beta hydrolase n=1 Tax=Kitasatospora sp. NPDC088391 TaxID=3364074 RepID=UPI0037F2FB3C
MTTVAAPPRPGVRRIALPGGELTLSALLAEPVGPPRATVLAVHGGGTSAGYFHGQAHPDLSLLTLGADLGYAVLAVDRPGYGDSAAAAPGGRSLAEQGGDLHAAMARYAREHAVGAGVFLLAHSFGGKLALTYAAEPAPADAPPLLGLDVSGLGRDYAVDPDLLNTAPQKAHWRRNWGALRYYPPNTFRDADAMVHPMPPRERAEAAQWPGRFAELAARVRVPVRLTFAEVELWWRHDDGELAELAAQFASAPAVSVHRQRDAGHNISLGWTARAYHLQALSFFEECLAGRAAGAAAGG